MSDLKPYPSGYMKPPKEHRFKKGKSGNPKGRPKQPETLASITLKVLNKKIRVKGEDRKVTLLEALALRLRELAAKGYPRAIEITRRYEAIVAEQVRLRSLDEEDEVIARFRRAGYILKNGEIFPVDDENNQDGAADEEDRL